MNQPKLIGARARCASCGETFSTERGFNLHRRGPWAARKCADPVSVGLVQDAGGIWRRPAPKNRAVSAGVGIPADSGAIA